LVDVDFEPDEYEIIEKWFGMLFGKEESKSKFAPKDGDIQLFNKLSQMHMASLKNELREKNRIRDILGGDKDKDKDDEENDI